MFNQHINNEDELRTILGYPNELVQNKVISQLDENCIGFIAKSPFLLISSTDDSGNCDVSPRGDAAGFVKVLDDKHLVIPERPGNRRMDSMRNILINPRVGLIFVIPGLEETLRINGRAYVVRDEALRVQCEAFGRVPAVCIGVVVEECFVHCAKAFKRSGLWNPDTWLPADELPNMARILAEHIQMPGVNAEKVSQALKDSYTNRLY